MGLLKVHLPLRHRPPLHAHDLSWVGSRGVPVLHLFPSLFRGIERHDEGPSTRGHDSVFPPLSGAISKESSPYHREATNR